MKSSVGEVRIPFSPVFAAAVGINESLFLQQLHYRLQISKNSRQGHQWVYNTYEDWTNEFPCWTIHLVKRLVTRLEKAGFIISSEYNKMPMDRTKWYRIDYERLSQACGHSAPFEQSKTLCSVERNAPSEESVLLPAITKERKKTTNTLVYSDSDLTTISSAIDYLNEKTSKKFKRNASATMNLLHDLIKEGYTFEDFKIVIDNKVAQWLNDPHYRNFLRPTTLFNADKFDNYLNEEPAEQLQSNAFDTYSSPILDFGKGENPYEL